MTCIVGIQKEGRVYLGADRAASCPWMITDAGVSKVFKNGKIIASICHGGWILVSAGILRGKTVTSYFAIKDDITNAGAKWVDEEVVRDGNIITSRMPDDLPAFCHFLQ